MNSKKYFRRKELAATISLLLASYPVYAEDQSQDSTDQAGSDQAEEMVMEEVVVTGRFRKSLIDALGTKRDNTSIVEAISAEDIGKLPDPSIADALARMPGVSGERRNGRVSGISVRGFKEDYVGTTMNGRELLGMGDNRGVEYDLYPAEIVTGMVVYKTPDATQMTQGIGGIVDLRTIRPLESDRILAIGGVYEQNDKDSANPDYDDNGYRLSLIWSDTFADDTVGISFVAATTDSPSQEEQFRAWGYPPVNADNAGPGVDLNGDEVILGEPGLGIVPAGGIGGRDCGAHGWAFHGRGSWAGHSVIAGSPVLGPGPPAPGVLVPSGGRSRPPLCGLHDVDNARLTP